MPARSSRAFGPSTTTRYAVNGVSFDMVRVPPSRFTDGEGPGRREFLVSRPFDVGVTLVTQALWRAVMGSSPSRFSAPDRPVELVSWDDAQDLFGRLDGLGLRGFRLPTEAEWSWAARCGVSTYWAGADRPNRVAVIEQNGTSPVARLSASAAGAFDFSGNVWEWQSDRWSLSRSSGVDTQGSASGSDRMYRGGSWFYTEYSSRISPRYFGGPPLTDIGLRLFRTAL